MRPAENIEESIKKLQVTPSAQMRQRTLNDILEAQEKSEKTRSAAIQPDIWRTIMKSPITKLVAAAAIIIAVLIGINQFGGPVDLATPTFANVVRPFLTARTATFKVTIKAEGQPTQTIEGMYIEPARMCVVTPNGRTISDMEPDSGYCRLITLVLEEKKAIVTEVENMPDNEKGPGQFNMFAELKRRILEAQELDDESVEFLGEQLFKDRTVIGYHVLKPDLDMTVWADTETLLPISIETSMGPSSTLLQRITIIMTDFAFDVELDESLFSIPEDFSIITMPYQPSQPSEKDLIEVFRKWAECVDGKFPSVLEQEAVKEYIEAYGKKAFPNFRAGDKLSDEQQQEMLQIYSKIVRAFTFAKGLPGESDWHYAGKDATFGDAETAIFWYRPQGSQTYRVIYGDLSVNDVAPENLPR